MKNYKPIISIILAAVIVFSFAACTAKPENESTTAEVTESVTEPVSFVPVTDKDGKAVTEVVTDSKGEKVTDKNGKTVTVVVTQKAAQQGAANQVKKTTAAQTTAKKDAKKKDSKKDSGKKDSTTSTTAKIKNPSTVKEIKVSDITENSVKLSWDGVVCDYYELYYKQKDAERWDTIDEKLEATGIDVSGLESMTEYSFRLRAIIESKAGKSPSAFTFVDVKTKAQDKTRKIKISVKLPARNNNDDKLVVYIKEGKKDKVKIGEADVKLDGSTVDLGETKGKYKGVVTVEARLKKIDAKESEETDKDSIVIDISNVGIDTIYDED